MSQGKEMANLRITGIDKAEGAGLYNWVLRRYEDIAYVKEQ